eukprot:scaffold659_cov318-Pavlova_lutheri.AAC.9
MGEEHMFVVCNANKICGEDVKFVKTMETDITIVLIQFKQRSESTTSAIPTEPFVKLDFNNTSLGIA